MTLRAKGKMFVHGVEKEIEVPAVLFHAKAINGDVKAKWQILAKRLRYRSTVPGGLCESGPGN